MTKMSSKVQVPSTPAAYLLSHTFLNSSSEDLSVCLSVRLSVCPSVCLYVCLPSTLVCAQLKTGFLKINQSINS